MPFDPLIGVPRYFLHVALAIALTSIFICRQTQIGCRQGQIPAKKQTLEPMCFARAQANMYLDSCHLIFKLDPTRECRDSHAISASVDESWFKRRAERHCMTEATIEARQTMAFPDSGPLLDEQLDELELICAASERGGCLTEDDLKRLNIADAFEEISFILGWHDRHDRKLLEAARWALAHGWRREERVTQSRANQESVKH